MNTGQISALTASTNSTVFVQPASLFPISETMFTQGAVKEQPFAGVLQELSAVQNPGEQPSVLTNFLNFNNEKPIVLPRFFGITKEPVVEAKIASIKIPVLQSANEPAVANEQKAEQLQETTVVDIPVLSAEILMSQNVAQLSSQRDNVPQTTAISGKNSETAANRQNVTTATVAEVIDRKMEDAAKSEQTATSIWKRAQIAVAEPVNEAKTVETPLAKAEPSTKVAVLSVADLSALPTKPKQVEQYATKESVQQNVSKLFSTEQPEQKQVVAEEVTKPTAKHSFSTLNSLEAYFQTTPKIEKNVLEPVATKRPKQNEQVAMNAVEVETNASELTAKTLSEKPVETFETLASASAVKSVETPTTVQPAKVEVTTVTPFAAALPVFEPTVETMAETTTPKAAILNIVEPIKVMLKEALTATPAQNFVNEAATVETPLAEAEPSTKVADLSVADLSALPAKPKQVEQDATKESVQQNSSKLFSTTQPEQKQVVAEEVTKPTTQHSVSTLNTLEAYFQTTPKIEKMIVEPVAANKPEQNEQVAMNAFEVKTNASELATKALTTLSIQPLETVTTVEVTAQKAPLQKRVEPINVAAKENLTAEPLQIVKNGTETEINHTIQTVPQPAVSEKNISDGVVNKQNNATQTKVSLNMPEQNALVAETNHHGFSNTGNQNEESSGDDEQQRIWFGGTIQNHKQEATATSSSFFKELQNSTTSTVPEQASQQLKETLSSREYKQGVEHISIRLTPENMGELKLTFRMEGQQLKIDVATETNGVRDSLLKHADSIKETLAKQNISLDSFNVSTNSQHQNQSGRDRSEWQELAKQRQHAQLWMNNNVQNPELNLPQTTIYQAKSAYSMLDVHF